MTSTWLSTWQEILREVYSGCGIFSLVISMRHQVTFHGSICKLLILLKKKKKKRERISSSSEDRPSWELCVVHWLCLGLN